jgi:hypothetical protein
VKEVCIGAAVVETGCGFLPRHGVVQVVPEVASAIAPPSFLNNWRRVFTFAAAALAFRFGVILR